MIKYLLSLILAVVSAEQSIEVPTLIDAMRTHDDLINTNADRNATMNLVMNQAFFDNASEYLIAPVISNVLSGIHIGNDIINKTLGIHDLIEFDFNMTDKLISDASLNGSVSLIEITEEGVILQVTDFALNITFNYAVISDPPIFADIGDAYL